MAKYIVLSVNDNPDYLYFTPLVCWAWRQFGWEPIVFFGDSPRPNLDIDKLALKEEVYRLSRPLIATESHSDTKAQMSRLYAACVQEGYLMTGDIDMIPLSDYWKPQEDTITVYGHDLTSYGHYPICYIGMPHTRWIEVMGLSSSDYNALIKRDLDTLPQARNPDFYKYWFSDQDLITQRLKEVQFPITSILRGQYKNGFAHGRVDRGAWTLDHPQFIDAHLHHQIYHSGNEWKFDKTMELLRKVWPNEDFTWFTEYHKQFKRLTGHD
jgi:hypothetical protein